MPDRPKNRPRIAGQRRTPVTPVTDRTSTTAPETPDTPAEVTPRNHPTPEIPTTAETTNARGSAPSASRGDAVTAEDTGELGATGGPTAHAEGPASGGAASSGGRQEPASVGAPDGTAVGGSDRSAATGKSGSTGPIFTDPAPVGRVARVLAAVLGVLIVLVLALAGVLGVKAWRGKQAEDARGEAVAAGRKAAETALSYDYRKLDQSFGDARATMTPEFAAKFDETAQVAGELAAKTKATVRAEVREVGVRDGDANRVTLIIFVNQTTTSTITQGKPRVDLNRTRFTMVRSGARWLVQEIAGL